MRSVELVKLERYWKDLESFRPNYRVYIAGPKHRCDPIHDQRWRRRFASDLQRRGMIGVLPVEDTQQPELEDLHDISTCWAFYANLFCVSAGTAVEMYVAKYVRGIPVIAFVSIPDPSPWVAFCSTVVVKSRRAALDELSRLRRETMVEWLER